MKQTVSKRILSLLLVVMLCAAMALTGCSDTTSSAPSEEPKTTGQVMGEGSQVFTFTVTDAEGKDTVYEIHTDKTTVGDALLELELIAGEDSEYGLYVKTVAGTTLDYNTDGKYWAFYVNGEYAMSGVDTTEIEAGAAYAFKAE